MNEDRILDTHSYCIVIATRPGLENELIDCHFWDVQRNCFKEGFEGMCFDEKSYLLLESFLFNFINAECNLVINMYEEEFANVDQLPKMLEITEEMINNCDNENFIKLANEFRNLLCKAITENTVVGFCF